MGNNYQYIDPDYKYTNKNGVIHNLANIEDEKILLALEKDLKLNLNPPDNKGVYERYMHGTINSDVKILTGLILEQVEKNRKEE